MKPSRDKHRFRQRVLFFAVLAAIAVAVAYSGFHGSSRTWLVPEEAKQLKNPLQSNAALLESARRIYEEKCAKCHGDRGKGDGTDAGRYDPAPTDFTDARRMSGATDGELFYKISEGKKPMPVFKTKLSEEQRWELVLLIRQYSQRSASSAPLD